MAARSLERGVDRLFRITERGTTLRAELIGGLTTFAAMAYIIVVNPAILQFAGLPVGPSTVATILTAVVGSLLMALYANRPLAVAPYMACAARKQNEDRKRIMVDTARVRRVNSAAQDRYAC